MSTVTALHPLPLQLAAICLAAASAAAQAPIAPPVLRAEPVSSAAAVKELEAWLAAAGAPGADLASQAFARLPLTKTDAARARELLRSAHKARIIRERSAEVNARKITDGKLEMPLHVETFGAKPPFGRSLWISLHGGGGSPRAVNDSQWRNQKRLYRLEEGIYVAPRAPTDTWDLWHQPHIDRMFGRLIEDMIVLEDVDPDRVYVLGYSAGGDGVYQLAPRMADRWAAAAMMAGHPNDSSPLSLRNIGFALQAGADDSAYNRNQVAKEWGEELDRLRAADPGGYLHFVKIHEGKGHWMDREDAAALPWMAKLRRDPTPSRIVWKQDDVTHESSYWLAVPPGKAASRSLVVAERKGQAIEIEKAEGIEQLLFRLDDRMLDLERPVQVTMKGSTLFEGLVPRTIAVLDRTLAARGDPGLVFEAEVSVSLR